MMLLSGDRPNRAARPADHEEVRVVVVSFAKTPLIAAHAPDDTARMIQTGCRRRRFWRFARWLCGVPSSGISAVDGVGDWGRRLRSGMWVRTRRAWVDGQASATLW